MVIFDVDILFDEFQVNWVLLMVVGLGWLLGCMVGVLVNNLLCLGGCLNFESVEKVVCFVWLCDVFGILLVVVVDVLGYLFGVDQEWGGVVCCGVKLLYVFGECIVLWVMLVI